MVMLKNRSQIRSPNLTLMLLLSPQQILDAQCRLYPYIEFIKLVKCYTYPCQVKRGVKVKKSKNKPQISKKISSFMFTLIQSRTQLKTTPSQLAFCGAKCSYIFSVMVTIDLWSNIVLSNIPEVGIISYSSITSHLSKLSEINSNAKGEHWIKKHVSDI